MMRFGSWVVEFEWHRAVHLETVVAITIAGLLVHTQQLCQTIGLERGKKQRAEEHCKFPHKTYV
jgi:hypothetical protein